MGTTTEAPPPCPILSVVYEQCRAAPRNAVRVAPIPVAAIVERAYGRPPTRQDVVMATNLLRAAGCDVRMISVKKEAGGGTVMCLLDVAWRAPPSRDETGAPEGQEAPTPPLPPAEAG